LTKGEDVKKTPPTSRWFSRWRSRPDGFEYAVGHEWQLYHRSWRKTYDLDALSPFKRFVIMTLFWGAFPMFAFAIIALIWLTR
jgi:hypothetical protein